MKGLCENFKKLLRWGFAHFHRAISCTILYVPNKTTTRLHQHNWLGFYGTFSTNNLYCAFEKYVAGYKIEIIDKVENVTCYM